MTMGAIQVEPEIVAGILRVYIENAFEDLGDEDWLEEKSQNIDNVIFPSKMKEVNF